MIARRTIRNAFDDLTATTFAAAPALPVVYGNQKRLDLSEGTSAYVKQRVFFTGDNQAELGNRCFRRQQGYILFMIFVRVGTGDLERDDILDRITLAFASKQVGAATTMDPLIGVSSETEDWVISSVNIPFYFDNPVTED